MGTARFLSCGGGNDGLDGILHNVAQFEGLDEVTATLAFYSNIVFMPRAALYVVECGG